MTTTNNKTNNTKNHLKAIFWLIEALFRSFVGWYLIIITNNKLIQAVGVYALITVIVIVYTHFEKAHKG